MKQKWTWIIRIANPADTDGGGAARNALVGSSIVPDRRRLARAARYRAISRSIDSVAPLFPIIR